MLTFKSVKYFKSSIWNHSYPVVGCNGGQRSAFSKRNKVETSAHTDNSQKINSWLLPCSASDGEEETNVTGFTVSATANVDLETNGIYQLKETSNFVVYPNPANSTLNVELEKRVNNGMLSLFDMSGKAVLSQAINGTSAQVNMSSLTAGNYILRLVENGTARQAQGCRW